MFVLGETARCLVNEIAPRVHNSGHWTLDGASVSQFEQHIRAVAGWPLGKPIRKGRVEMINLIGHEVEDYRKWLTVPGAAVHLYGKIGRAPRPQDGARDAEPANSAESEHPAAALTRWTFIRHSGRERAEVA